MKIKQTSTFNKANASGIADWLCTTCLWTPQNIQLRRLCHRNWRAARIPKVLFTGADFVTLSFAFGLCRALAEILRRWSAHLFIYSNDYAPSMITASSVTRINATAHFIRSNTRNVFKVLIFFHSRSSKAQKLFQNSTRTRFLGSIFRNKTADGKLFSEFFYRRASWSPLTG